MGASRLRDDFQLAIVSLLGLTTLLTLAGFLVWRLTRGEWWLAAFDATVVLAIGSVVRLAWRPGRTETAGTLMALFNTGFCAAACVLIGEAASGWVYVALMTNFYIARMRIAACCGALLIAAASAVLVLPEDGIERPATVVTWLLVYAFSFVFSRRIRVYNDSLERRATLDPLTRLPNRGAMEAHLRNLMADRRQTAAGLLVLDIDRFKAVNDTFGHAVGDAVLVELAAILRDELREDDAAYRFGGEEFVLVLPVDDAAALAAAAERLRGAVEQRLRSPGGPVTVSIGGAMLAAEHDWQDWFGRADTSLYLAKRAGRNRSHIAQVLAT
ncbi:GGDEF domain-containing protein [Luteimonas sp. FCS-9]|uniref:GGDEF domain-containing protein n=1 Tax=Luteimonas sp. FCS-9 TaxID=1547516 RepID=UPI00063EBE1C|nr:GGDEF domain-containing protein [Luteimonas sp. FCS-9]KLJ01333.1 hypothetical protein WQ56_06065 [Luteimonas sp. FCS-9]